MVFPLQSGVHLDHGKPIQSHLNIHIMLEFDVIKFPKYIQCYPRDTPVILRVCIGSWEVKYVVTSEKCLFQV